MEPTWKRYYENSKPTPEEEVKLIDAEKKNKEDLILEAQDFEDIKSAVNAIGKIQDGSKIYAANDLERIFEGVRKGTKALAEVPNVFGLKAAASHALEAIARQDYEQSLKNLFEKFQTLFEAGSFSDVFESFDIDDDKLSAEAKIKKLETEYRDTSKLFQSGKLKNPDNSNRMSAEIREIAEKAKMMLDFYKGEADNALEKQRVKELGEKNERKFDPKNLEQLLANKETIKVKIKRGSGNIEEDWIIESVLNSDITVSKINTTPPITLNVIPDDLKKWNTDIYKAKNVVNPRSDDAEKKSLEEKHIVAEKFEKDLNDKRTEDKKAATKKREKFEAKKVKVEEDQKKKEVPTDFEEEKLLQEIDRARKEFAQVEYKERTSLERIRKFLHIGSGLQEKINNKKKINSGPSEKEKEKLEKSQNVQKYQECYQDALRAFMEHEINKLENSGLEKDELKKQIKDLYSFFNLDETTRYYDVRTEVKMEYLKGSEAKDGKEKAGWQENLDKAHLKMKEAAEWYNKKVPLKVKLGLAAVTFVPGAAFAFGAVVPATGIIAGATGLALARRAWGAMMVASSGGMFADKLIQGWDKKVDERQRDRDFRTLREKGEIKYDNLRKMLDGKITDIDGKLNKRNLTSSASKYLAFGAAMFSTASLVNSLSDFHGAMEASTVGLSNTWKSVKGLWDHGATAQNGVGVEEATRFDPAKRDFKHASGAHKGVGTQKLDHSLNKQAGVGPTNVEAAPTVPAAPAPEELPIKEGSSIEAALRDHYRAAGIEHPGAKADVEFRNYMSAKIKAMQEALEKNPDNAKQAAKLKEYKEMLKTGRVNVHEGDKLFVDADGKLTDIKVAAKYGGDIKMLHDVPEHHHVAAASHPAAVAETPGSGAGHDVVDAATRGAQVDTTSYNIDNVSHGVSPFPPSEAYARDFVQYNPEHLDGSDSLVQAELPSVPAHSSNVINFSEAAIGSALLAGTVFGNNKNIKKFVDSHDHRGVLREVRKMVVKNGDAWREHRADNVFKMVENDEQVFSKKGRQMVAKLIKSKDFKPDGKIISLEEYTRDIARKLAA